MELRPDTDLERDLDICKDDLPLKANTNHMLVRHYELDLTADFDREVISGSIVLFLEAGKGPNPTPSSTTFTSGNEGPVSPLASDAALGADRGCFHGNSRPSEGVVPEWEEGEGSGDSDGDFVLVLDCCDLAVQKVEELDVAAVPAMGVLLSSGVKGHVDGALSDILARELISMPSSQWRRQLDLFSQCSRAPAPPAGGDLQFHTDRWSLQISKSGVHTPHAFPLAVRIWYQTKPEGASVSWTRDQSDRPCVYTQGSPINNRSLFPCQEPPVAMSTWQARVRAPSECVVLMSGENQACPVPEETGFSCWEYYVTMPMPASTFTIAIGQWVEATAPASAAMTDLRMAVDVSGVDPCHSGRLEHEFSPLDVESDSLSVTQMPCSEAERTSLSQVDCSGLTNPDCCSHMDYPCRFSDPTAQVQAVIGHRVFASPCLLQQAESLLLPLLPSCLAAAHHHLGVHPFSRLDVLIVPPGFSSLGMASPHIVFLAQSVLSGENALCGARLCHEIAHAWFGLAIGARDWTEEWISEGFATYLEDVFWATVKQKDTGDEAQLKALLRWRRLKDELHNSVKELQILRPLRDGTGAVSESGSSVVKHALNPEKPFMQVHYLKGYFLLKFLASKMGEEEFLRFMRLFVKKYHGQLILSQDFLGMLFEKFPHVQSPGFTLEAVYSDWLDRPGIPETLEGESEGWFRSSLVEEVKVEAVKWVEFGTSRVKRGKRRRLGSKLSSRELTPEQLVLLLELLLEEAELSVTSLRMLERTYGLRRRDAEVRHRWCELVVKHRHAAAYGDVERFLLEDQAMGVYLYGELMVNEDAEQQALAKLCFSRAQRLMDSSTRQLVQEMIL